VTLMIRAIWPSYNNGRAGNPSRGIGVEDFVSFVVFWTASLPAIWFPVHQIRHLFTIKAYIVPTAGIALFAWAIRRAHGMGPIIHQPATAQGAEFAWGIVGAIMSSIANFATVIVNNPDFTRFARTPSDALWPQLLTIPVGFAVTSFIGIVVSSSSNVIFGTTIWNPLELLSQMLDEPDANTGSRFGVLAIASAFALAQLGTNIAANSVSAGTDMTALLPQYINIRRGGYVCAVVGLAICPWRFLSSSSNFTTYLSAYSVFLSSIAGVIVCDYYIVRRGHLEVKSLYSTQKTSPYYYCRGWSWRAYLSYGCGVLVNIFGFMDALGVPRMPLAAVYVYRLNFFAGFGVASAVYYLLCK
jgi:NCS1 family nucleobase:cation symporter-1